MSEKETIYIRSHIEPIGKVVSEKQPPKNTKVHAQWARYALCFDTETRIDLGQELTFGVWRLCELRGTVYVCIEEGLFYADNLPSKERKVLEDYVQLHTSDVTGFPPRYPLYSCSDFIHKVFYKWAKKGAHIVGLNLPFDLCRITSKDGWKEGHKNEWSLILSRYVDGNEKEHNPRVSIEPLDSKKAFICFNREWTHDGHPTDINESRFLDLRTLLWALFNQSYSLKRACDNVKGPFKGQNLPQKIDHKPTGEVTFEEISYARQDGRCTEGLLNATKHEFDLHSDIDLDPDKAYSPATMAKNYLEAMGIEKPKKFNVPTGIQNIAMESYTGGRSEAKIRLAEVPVVPVDLTSEYPSVCVLLGLWHVITAESLDFPDATKEVQKLLSGISLDGCYERDAWKSFLFFARIKPDRTLLPVRKMYNGVTEGIGNNYLSSTQEIWVAGPDLVASVIRTGKVPRVLEAIRVVPIGKQKEMRLVKLRGMIDIDPYKHDMFKRVIELRKSKTTNKDLAYALKIFANAMYGFFAEVNPENVRPLKVKVFKGKDSSSIYTPKKKNPRDKVVTIEKQGQWYASYLASLITSGGRLLLGMIEESVTRAGGTYLYADTDALGIVASENGGPLDYVPGCKEQGVRALSWKEVKAIVDRFEFINPYDRDAVPNLRFLNLTDDNYTDKAKTKRRALLGLSLSAKRYVLYERDGEKITIINPKAHGLGYLYPPCDSPEGWEDEHEMPFWIHVAWEWMLRRILGLKQIDVPWLKYPQMQREAVTTVNLLRGLHQWGEFRPFNFFMRPVAHKHNAGRGETALSLVTRLVTDSSAWASVECFNTADPSDENVYRITTDIMDTVDSPGSIWVKNFETLLLDYIAHPESKSLGPDGKDCTGRTCGLLQRRHIYAEEIERIGKELPRGLEEGDNPSEVMEFEPVKYAEQTTRKDMVQPSKKHVQQLRRIGYRKLMRSGCSQRFLQKIQRREFIRAEYLHEFEKHVRESHAL